MSANKVKYGLKNVHYAVATETGGTLTYATPVPIPGGVSLTLEPKGEKAEFYADALRARRVPEMELFFCKIAGDH